MAHSDADTLVSLAAMHCKPNAPRLDSQQASKYVTLLPGWTLAGDSLEKTYRFANYYETIAFVNALAYIAHREDHHPDLGVHYNRCSVTFSTHSAGGVTLNDVVCAAKAERLAG